MDNPHEAGEFFRALDEAVTVKQKMFVDLSAVKRITLDAVAYLITFAKDRDSKCKLGGNLPNDELCKQLIRQSGFMEHVYHKQPCIEECSDVCKIRQGAVVDPGAAEQLVLFLQKISNLSSDTPLTKAIYATLIECMANTNNHAFGVAPMYRRGKHWYVMAWHDKLNGCMEFAFIDTGAGIPKTVRKRWKEKLVSMVGKCSDADLIAAALDGRFPRSQTGLTQRGKGLPRIARHASEKLISRLMVRSLKGFVSTQDDGSLLVDNKAWMFQGSLLSWRVRIPSSPAPQLIVEFAK